MLICTDMDTHVHFNFNRSCNRATRGKEMNIDEMLGLVKVVAVSGSYEWQFQSQL